MATARNSSSKKATAAETTATDTEEASNTATTPTNAPTSPKPAIELGSTGKFKWVMEELAEVPLPPVTEGRSPSTNDLPFKQWFGSMPHNGHVFVPTSFWTDLKSEGGREVHPKKVTSSYVRAKIRGAFNDWKAKDKDGSMGRQDRKLLLYPRQAGDDNGRFKEPGMSVFMQVVATPKVDPSSDN